MMTRPNTTGRSPHARRGALALFAASFALAAAAPAPASAQPRRSHMDPRMGEAKRLFDDGAAAYAQGSYDLAIKYWQQSYDLSQKPLIFESIANAWERLGDAKKARENLAKWRAYAPMEERDLLDARIHNLDTRIQREEEAERKAAAERAAAEAAAAQQAAKAQDARPWALGAIVGGAGLAVVIAGVAVDVAATLKRPDASLCKTSGGMTLCRQAAQDPITTSNRLALAGDITWAVGAAAVAAGAVLIVVRRPWQRDAAPRPAAWIAPSAGGLLFGGRF